MKEAKLTPREGDRILNEVSRVEATLYGEIGQLEESSRVRLDAEIQNLRRDIRGANHRRALTEADRSARASLIGGFVFGAVWAYLIGRYLE